MELNFSFALRFGEIFLKPTGQEIWLVLRAGIDENKKEKYLYPNRESNPNHPIK
jgi:hypothetical protein